jgi:hypothetical protein
MTIEATPQQLFEFLREHQVLTLAVAGPYAAAVFYCVDTKLNLYFVTDPKTRHGAALLRGTTVAGTIQRDRQRWQEIRGVQFTGTCRRLTGASRVTGMKLYRQRFASRGTNKLLADAALWKITPDWMRLIDNGVKFGHRSEWSRR